MWLFTFILFVCVISKKDKIRVEQRLLVIVESLILGMFLLKFYSHDNQDDVHILLVEELYHDYCVYSFECIVVILSDVD